MGHQAEEGEPSDENEEEEDEEYKKTSKPEPRHILGRADWATNVFYVEHLNATLTQVELIVENLKCSLQAQKKSGHAKAVWFAATKTEARLRGGIPPTICSRQ